MCVGAAPLDAIAGVTKAVGSVFSGKIQSTIDNDNAAMADQNADYANKQAGQAISLGSEQVSQTYLKAGLMKGQQTAAEGANGVETGFGSPAEVVADTSTLSEIDANTLRQNASQAAEGYRISAVNYRNQANVDRLGGQAAQFSGYVGAAGSLLSSASQVDKDLTMLAGGG